MPASLPPATSHVIFYITTPVVSALIYTLILWSDSLAG